LNTIKAGLEKKKEYIALAQTDMDAKMKERDNMKQKIEHLGEEVKALENKKKVSRRC